MSRAARIPRHLEISDALRRQIEERELFPGDLLPSEGELCRSFAVSRSVVRQALDTLVREGVVRKAQGRGTTVSVRSEMHRDPLWSAGLSTQMARFGSRVSTRVLSYEIENVPTVVRGLSGPQALRIERLRFVDDEPTAFIRTWLPCDLSELIPAASLEDASLHEQLYARAGLIVSARNRQVRATAARSPIDGLLGIASGSPLLLLEGQSQDQYGRIIEERDLVGHVQRLAPAFQSRLRAFADHPLVGDVRGVGLVGGIELVADKAQKQPFSQPGILGSYIFKQAHKHGLIIRSIYDTVAFCPPLITTEDDVDAIFSAFERTLSDATDWARSQNLL